MTKKLHQQQNPQIRIEDWWIIRDQVNVVDVRSPKECNEGSIPGAVNLPLLSDTERSRVGLLYKKMGQAKAVDEGYQILEPKLDHFRAYFDQFSKKTPLVVYCARGGMRSQVITALSRTLGYEAKQLTGGYKAFRNYTLAFLAISPLTSPPVVLHGKTGVGKTMVLTRLANSLDLEGLAQHRGSLFGGIGKDPVTQKTFEARLLTKIASLDQCRPIFVEGESRKIGDLTVPPKLFESMKNGRIILLEASIETRVARTVEEYVTNQPGNCSEIRAVIGLLEKDLGKKNVKRLQEEFDNGEYEKCFEYILLNYYDKKYAYSMKKLVIEDTISSENIAQAIHQLSQIKA